MQLGVGDRPRPLAGVEIKAIFAAPRLSEADRPFISRLVSSLPVGRNLVPRIRRANKAPPQLPGWPANTRPASAVVSGLAARRAIFYAADHTDAIASPAPPTEICPNSCEEAERPTPVAAVLARGTSVF